MCKYAKSIWLILQNIVQFKINHCTGAFVASDCEPSIMESIRNSIKKEKEITEFFWQLHDNLY